jgi:N6-adenosine-specific RNA methylase IME4
MRRARVIVADPPWPFRDKLPGPGRGASKHYGLLSLADLCTFALPPIADDAWLFLWRVSSMQREAIAVARAWGFSDPVSELVWAKTTNDGQRLRLGMGRTVRNSHEVCMLCRRGRPKRADAGVPSVLLAPRGEHSAKPDRFFDLVERFARGPYVEMFSRRRRPRWSCFGDEVDGRVRPGTEG